MEFEGDFSKFDFKFNHSWIGETDFSDLVHKHWKCIDLSSGDSNIVQIMDSLKILKSEMCNWEKTKKRLCRLSCYRLEKILINCFIESVLVFSSGDGSLLLELEDRKIKILLMEEEAWRLKSKLYG